MKAKKIIERVFKVINILVNFMICGIGFIGACEYGTNGYMYSDTILRMVWIIGMFVMVNAGDYLIRKIIRDF